MSLSRSSGLLAAAVAAGVLVGIGHAGAAPVTLLNPSFESPDVGDDATSTFITDWGFAGSGAGGVSDPVNAQYAGATGDNAALPAPATGGQVAYINDDTSVGNTGFIFQNLEGRFVQSGEILTLTAAIGNRADIIDETFAIQLVTFSGNVIATFSGDAETFATSGSFRDAIATSAPGAGVGDAAGLQIQLINTNTKAFNPANAAGIQVNFDNVRLESTFIPEPASLSLLGVGGLAALRRRRV